jgi:RNA polymerase sigma-70 factor (ECF subfamily)
MRHAVFARRPESPQTVTSERAFDSCDHALNYEAALLACASGGQSALGRIYVADGARLHDIALRIVHDRDRAEDVVHDAFAQILRDAKSFDPARGSARGWIYAIVRNTALKSRHHAGREIAVDDERLSALSNQREDTVEPSPHLGEGAALRAHLENLEPRRRASLILAIVDGRTHAEIAAYLRVPNGTVKSWIRRELVLLRERLK